MPNGRLATDHWVRKAANTASPSWKAGCVGCFQPHTHETTAEMQPHERDFTNLVNERGL
jgi:hypothetical protein